MSKLDLVALSVMDGEKEVTNKNHVLRTLERKAELLESGEYKKVIRETRESLKLYK